MVRNPMPFLGDRANAIRFVRITPYPRELMQVCARGFVNILGRQISHLLIAHAVETYSTPQLALIGVLRVPAELGCFLRRVVVFTNRDGVKATKVVPQLCYVPEANHIAIEEQGRRPPVITQVRGKEGAEAKLCGTFILAPIDAC